MLVDFQMSTIERVVMSIESPASHSADAAIVDRLVAEVVKPVLGVTSIGVDDSLLDSAASSLQLVQMAAEIQMIFGVEISLIDLFDEPTVTALAAMVEDGLAEQEEYS